MIITMAAIRLDELASTVQLTITKGFSEYQLECAQSVFELQCLIMFKEFDAGPGLQCLVQLAAFLML